MSEFRKGDVVRIIERKKNHPSWYNAFVAMNFNDTSSNRYSDEDDLKHKFKVIGAYEQAIGVEYKDRQLAIDEDGLMLLRRVELNNRIKIL